MAEPVGPQGSYPWHRAAYQQIVEGIRSERLTHALLLTGAEGSGKSQFAHAATGAVLCADPSQDGACGTCAGCRLMASGTHPDYHVLTSESVARPAIGVDAVRGLADELTLASQYPRGRVAIIDPADQLTLQAANSLLKTLEEPPARGRLILVAARLSRVPPTIRSRCQTMVLATPSLAEGQAWLEGQGRGDAVPLLGLAGGAPLRAMALAEQDMERISQDLAADLAALSHDRASPTGLAAKWQSSGASTVVWLVMHLLADTLRAKASGQDALRLTASEQLLRLVETRDWRVVYRYSDELLALRRGLYQPLNETLALERLFLGWRRSLAVVAVA